MESTVCPGEVVGRGGGGVGAKNWPFGVKKLEHVNR